METNWMAVKAPDTRNASHVLTRSQMPLQSSITLVWAPAPNNGAQISTYILEQSDKETGRYELVRALEDVLTCTVPNLQSGRSYWFRVRAENLVRCKNQQKECIVLIFFPGICAICAGTQCILFSAAFELALVCMQT